MVVLRLALFDPVRVGGHPAEVVGEPAHDFVPRSAFGRPGAGSSTSIARATSTRWIVSMMPTPRPVDDAVDGLRVAQVRGHARLLVDEPGPQVARGVPGVARVAGEHPGRSQRRHDAAQAHEGLPVADEVVRVRLAVSSHVGAAGVRRVGPPVVALGEEVVAAPRRPRRGRRRHRDRRLLQVDVGRREHPFAIEGAHVDRRDGSRRGQGDESGQGHGAHSRSSGRIRPLGPWTKWWKALALSDGSALTSQASAPAARACSTRPAAG